MGQWMRRPSSAYWLVSSVAFPLLLPLAIRPGRVTAEVTDPSALVPETGMLFEWRSDLAYQGLLRRFLLEPRDGSDGQYCAKCVMIAEQDGYQSRPESSVYLLEKGESVTVVARRVKRSLKGALREALGSASGTPGEDALRRVRFTGSDVEEARATLPREDADLLEQAWEMMLDRVRHPTRIETKAYIHPAIVHFSHCDSTNGVRGGRALVARGLPGEFAAIAFALEAYAFAESDKRSAMRQALMTQVNRLIGQLRALGATPPSVKQRRSIKAGVLEPPK